MPAAGAERNPLRGLRRLPELLAGAHRRPERVVRAGGRRRLSRPCHDPLALPVRRGRRELRARRHPHARPRREDRRGARIRESWPANLAAAHSPSREAAPAPRPAPARQRGVRRAQSPTRRRSRRAGRLDVMRRRVRGTRVGSDPPTPARYPSSAVVMNLLRRGRCRSLRAGRFVRAASRAARVATMPAGRPVGGTPGAAGSARAPRQEGRRRQCRCRGS
jgi:hypothetical protein